MQIRKKSGEGLGLIRILVRDLKRTALWITVSIGFVVLLSLVQRSFFN